jgi:SprB repeat
MGLTSGTYPATISDKNLCPGSATGVPVGQASTITASEMTTPASCNGGNDGTVKVTVNGGTPPYSVTVNGATKSVAASGGGVTFMGLAFGTYPATISDNKSCPGSAAGVLVVQQSCGCNTTSSITSNFNGTSISPSNYIWFKCQFQRERYRQRDHGLEHRYRLGRRHALHETDPGRHDYVQLECHVRIDNI